MVRQFQINELKLGGVSYKRGALITYFKDMRDSGLYCDSDVIHVQCLRFCFMSTLQDELHRAARFWNVHRIRSSSNPGHNRHLDDRICYVFCMKLLKPKTFWRVSIWRTSKIAKDMSCQQDPPITCSQQFEDARSG